MSRASGLADAKLEQFRRELIDELALDQGFDPSLLAGRMATFVREGVKEASVQRRRASLLVGGTGPAIPRCAVADCGT